VTEPRTVTLPDGRRLAYEEYGRTDGRPVFCFHGNPGSRLLWSLFDDLAQGRDLRLVAPDRPGFGRSEFHPDRDLLDWTEDVCELARELRIDRFGVVGFSAGGPHAAVCGAELPDRVTETVLVSSPGPPATLEHSTDSHRRMAAATQYPGVSRGLFGATGWLARNWRSRFRAAIERGASEPDRELLDSLAGDVILTDAAEAFRQGGKGPAHEYPLLAQKWPFDPADADPRLWHGRLDASVDLAVAQEFARDLPGPDLTVVDAGHYSTLVDEAESILTAAAP